MRILVACEESGRVRDAFRIRGHDAWSVDLKPCSGDPTYHMQRDVLETLHMGWDMMIGFPDCTFMTNSGVLHLHTDPSRWIKLFAAADFFLKLWNAPIPKIALENPIPHCYAARLLGIEYSQLFQPYHHGHPEQKATCLWLKGLSKLKETNNVYKEMMQLTYAERNKVHYMSPSPERAELRSKTYSGVADAMADQWGGEIELDLFGAVYD